jgi:FtsZ-binding cell division protein ZapB
MDRDELLNHLIEIKERQAAMHSDVQNMSRNIEAHEEVHEKLRSDVDSLQKDMHLAKGLIAVITTVAGYLGIDRVLK